MPIFSTLYKSVTCPQRKMRAVFIAVLVVFTVLYVALQSSPALGNHVSSPQFQDGKFRNVVPRPKDGFWKTVGILWDFTVNRPAGTQPAQPYTVRKVSQAELKAAPDRSLYRLGHSSVLIKLQGSFWITDPVFVERASPVQWAGPKRFHAPPIAFEDLPPLDGVILSHDHYDHLDSDTIRKLADKTEAFLTPLGVGNRLINWGIKPNKVFQLDWWQSVTLNGIKFVATPAQHFSGRGLFDGDKTLWASWVIIDSSANQKGTTGDTFRLFFSGDTGYFDGFNEIGKRYGPFDATLLDTGAYDLKWSYVHMLPEETIQAHMDLGGKWLIPIHNGTFELAMHPWIEPFERIAALSRTRGVALTTPAMGELLDLNAPKPVSYWWRNADSDSMEAVDKP